jgi:1,4-dihydroxy-2-naphthoate polyprenyltransferase
MHRLASIYWFFRLGRPLFLLGGFLFYGLGVAIAGYLGQPLQGAALIGGQLAVTTIQLFTHYSNDYFDLAADRANRTPTRWSGGSRILVAGHLPPRLARTTAVILAVTAVAISLVVALAVQPAPLTLPLLLLALLLAWGYSAPPLRLHSTGLGEVVGALLVPGLTPLVGFYLQTGRLTLLPVLAVVPLCCLQFAMLIAIGLPDAAGDAAVGKRTLVVRLGGAAAARLYSATLLVTYALLPLLVRAGLPAAVALAVLAGLPLAFWQAWQMARGAWARPGQWSRLALGSVVLLFGTGMVKLLLFLRLA